MYTYRCADCGAYLDPGEACDCMKKEEPPRCTAETPKAIIPSDYDSIPSHQAQAYEQRMAEKSGAFDRR